MADVILCHCGNSFSFNKFKSNKYCSEACWRADKRVKPKHCINCKSLFTPISYQRARRRFVGNSAMRTCSAQCHNQWLRNNPERKRKISKAFTGERHPNWQGGKSLLNNISGRGPNWQRQRAAALKRDKYCCVDCGVSQEDCEQRYGRGLDVDHVVPFHNFGSAAKANSLSNLQSRCASCHRTAEAKRGMAQMMLPLQESWAKTHKGRTYGERHNTAKLKEFQVLQIRSMADDGATQMELARKFGVSQSSIGAIVAGKTWRRLPLGKTAGASRLGRNGNLRGEDCGTSRLTEAQVMEMRYRANDGERIQSIADDMGETYASVYQIVRGKTWKHLPVLGYTSRRGRVITG